MYYILYYANAHTNSTGSEAVESVDSAIERMSNLKTIGYTHFSLENTDTGNEVTVPGYTN